MTQPSKYNPSSRPFFHRDSDIQLLVSEKVYSYRVMTKARTAANESSLDIVHYEDQWRTDRSYSSVDFSPGGTHDISLLKSFISGLMFCQA